MCIDYVLTFDNHFQTNLSIEYHVYELIDWQLADERNFQVVQNDHVLMN